METTPPEHLTEELAEIFGVIVGDGYIRGKPNWWLFIETSAEERVYIDHHLIPLFNDVFDINLKGRFFNRNGVRNTYGFYICSKELVKFLESFGLLVSHNDIRIPKKIRESKNRGIWKSFVRGYFDADGCLSFYRPNRTLRHTYPRIHINSTSEILIKDYKDLVEKLGFSGSYWKAGVFKKQKRIPHRYEIKGGKLVELWIKTIGISNHVKFSKYMVWKKFGLLPPYTTHNERIKMLNGYINPEKYYARARSSVG